MSKFQVGDEVWVSFGYAMTRGKILARRGRRYLVKHNYRTEKKWGHGMWHVDKPPVTTVEGDLHVRGNLRIG